MKTRPRSCSERDRREDLLDDLLAGPVGRVGLAGEDDLDRPLLVPQDPGAAGRGRVNSRPGPLVGREAPGEADREDVRIERRLERVEDRRRLAVAGELVAQPAPGEDRQLQLLALVGLPQLVGRDLGRGAPRTAPTSPSASRSSRSASEARAERLAHRVARSSVGTWMPFVTPRIRCGAIAAPGRVGGLGVELAHGVRVVRQAEREAGHVELGPVAVRARGRARGPRRSARRRSAAGRRRRGAGRRPAGRGRRRSARCRPRPACGS